jgi:hypothetical protein
MTRTQNHDNDGPPRHPMLGIYLNDHLAGATAGLELAHRGERTHQRRTEKGDLRRITAEISQDRAALLEIMAALGIAVRGYKVSAAWIGEKASRLKLNGRILSRSPLSDLEELEMLRLGVEGKQPASAHCAPWPTATSAWTPPAWTISFPGPGTRQICWKNSGSAPRARSPARPERPTGAGGCPLPPGRETLCPGTGRLPGQ